MIDYLRRLQFERPWLFYVLMFVGFWLAFQLVLFVAGLVLGPFGLPSWAPLALVLVLLPVALRFHQNRTRTRTSTRTIEPENPTLNT